MSSSSDSDDDVPQLSSETLCVLMEFYREQEERDEKLRQIEEGNIPDTFEENWNLSQFWYSEDTAKLLAEECVRVAGRDGAIACISSPTLYRALKDIDHNCTLKVLEYDTRFAVYKDDYVFYDYRNPLCVKPELREQFDVIVADPPYLSEDCLTKTAITVKFVMKSDARVILCSGEVMQELANRLLGLTKCQFEIEHQNNLSNPFVCYANYDLDEHCKRGEVKPTEVFMLTWRNMLMQLPPWSQTFTVFLGPQYCGVLAWEHKFTAQDHLAGAIACLLYMGQLSSLVRVITQQQQQLVAQFERVDE